MNQHTSPTEQDAGTSKENTNESARLKEELQQCELRSKEYLEGWQRAKADFINYKSEEGKRLEDMARFITTGLIQDILPVLDSFDLAFQYKMPKEMERGVLLIRSQFEDVLKKRGLEEISVVKGEPFNPEKHESIGEIASDVPEGAIVEVLQKGYTLRGKVLRPARVRLSKNNN
ncbi:MAG: nucleotide exchange factor GrpE [Candidatus Sungbacteria bacterium]|nr:nucleotide exchange factor GrpE [Candidatus Sungbacteria bacterium]